MGARVDTPVILLPVGLDHLLPFRWRSVWKSSTSVPITGMLSVDSEAAVRTLFPTVKRRSGLASFESSVSIACFAVDTPVVPFTVLSL